MAVIIMHPTEELKFSAFQKELISDLFDEKRILYAEKPLWINIPDSIFNEKITSIKLMKAEIMENNIFIPVEITTKENHYFSKLTLVNLYKGRQFTDPDYQTIAQKKEPVGQLKVFRLGIVQEEGLHAKSISKSVWCKLK